MQHENVAEAEAEAEDEDEYDDDEEDNIAVNKVKELDSDFDGPALIHILVLPVVISYDYVEDTKGHDVLEKD